VTLIRWTILGAVLLAGCEPLRHAAFRVDVADPDAVFAQVSLCGTARPMLQAHAQFVTRRRLDCEGEGDVRVRYADGTYVNCHIGYVTPGIDQSFHFAIKDRVCAEVPT
jgi:hypothetical protein